MGDAPVVAFLSAGRCGTKWLTEGLRELHPELEVEHHPIGPLYKPRLYFRRYDDPDAILEVPEVARHIDRIERADRTYVETGWPVFVALPLLAKRCPERLRVVHLTRHPVSTALAHLAERRYAGSGRDDGYARWATLGPLDPGVFQAAYARCWDRLSAYEKCLFWWTEVHLFGLELRGEVDAVPTLRVRSEDLLDGRRHQPLERLLEFIGVAWKADWGQREGRTDRWQPFSERDVDPLEIHRHPTTVDVARRLGYEIAELTRGTLAERYERRPDPLPRVA